MGAVPASDLAARLMKNVHGNTFALTISELVRLRVQDVDVKRGTVTVRLGKGNKDRVTVLPKSLREEVAQQIERARDVWVKDREAEFINRQSIGGWRGRWGLIDD